MEYLPQILSHADRSMVLFTWAGCVSDRSHIWFGSVLCIRYFLWHCSWDLSKTEGLGKCWNVLHLQQKLQLWHFYWCWERELITSHGNSSCHGDCTNWFVVKTIDWSLLFRIDCVSVKHTEDHKFYNLVVVGGVLFVWRSRWKKYLMKSNSQNGGCGLLKTPA